MIELTRTVRLSSLSNPDWRHPPRCGELDVTCRGHVDAITGFFLNIKDIDAAVRRSVGPMLESGSNDATHGARLLEMFRLINAEVGGTLRCLRWRMTPTFALALEANTMQECLVQQRYEFAASHRLHCPSLSEAENREVFGKCNNENGHGHNYRIEVSVRSSTGSETLPVALDVVDRIVRETVLDRFDHQHLNFDCAEFASLNPTVENIAMVCHDLLQSAFSEENIALHRVTVWETEKTSCTYPVEGSSP